MSPSSLLLFESPFVVHSGLVDTHGPAQLGISELVHQGRLPANPSAAQIASARDLLMDPEANVELLAAKLSRLKRELGLDQGSVLIASRSYVDAKHENNVRLWISLPAGNSTPPDTPELTPFRR